MATLMVQVEDALMERIADVAHERGEDTGQVIAEALRQAFRSKETDQDTTLDEEMLNILAPHWADQDRQGTEGDSATQTGSSGDAVEEYLSKHWADDIRKVSMNR